MADSKISDLTSGSPAQAGDLFVIARSGDNYKLTLTQLTLIESTARSAADTTLQSNITSEASTRASADTTLQTNITNEATSRATADLLLIPLTYLDTDGTLAANSDTKIATQKATKTYADAIGATVLPAASNAQAVAKSSTTVALVPANLQSGNYAASDTFQGLIQIATLAEVITGSSTTKAVTPGRMIGKRGSGTDSFLHYNVSSANTSSGTGTIAMGSGSSATSDYAISLGNATIASNGSSVAIGDTLTSSGLKSVALGYNSTVSGNYSFCAGSTHTITGANCGVLGISNTISAASCFAFTTSGTIGSSATGSAILGGTTNTINSSVLIGTIIGGNGRTLEQSYTTVHESMRWYGGVQRNIATSAITVNTTLDYTYELIPYNTSGGAITIKLPASPVNGQYYVFYKLEAAANALTIDGNGKNIIGASTLVQATAINTKVGLIYSSAAGQWLTV